MQIQDLRDLISLGDEICLAVNRAKLFKAECDELGKRVNQLAQMLETLFCFITFARTSLYSALLPRSRINLCWQWQFFTNASVEAYFTDSSPAALSTIFAISSSV
ncbi:hypothetical protein DITRI_Ditri01bG0014000 [Diplodiscus trichospermus]